MPLRHLVNLTIDRAGATINDYDVVARLEEFIATASAEIDGYLRRYTDMPIDPSVIPINGVITFTRSDSTVMAETGTGLFTEDLMRTGSCAITPSEVRPDCDPNYRMLVETITSDDEFEGHNVYYGPTLTAVTASLYAPNIPTEIRYLCRDHTAYMLWARRTDADQNPLKDKEANFTKIMTAIQNKKYRFETIPGGQMVSVEPTLTKLVTNSGKSLERTFNDGSMRGYTPWQKR